jgi:hypothetical protein
MKSFHWRGVGCGPDREMKMILAKEERTTQLFFITWYTKSKLKQLTLQEI